RISEIICQQAKARNHAIPAPALVLDADNVYFQGVAWLGTLHIDRAGERMNKGKIQGGEDFVWRLRSYLPRRGLQRLKNHRIARLDMYPRRKRVVPESMGLGVVEMMSRHVRSPFAVINPLKLQHTQVSRSMQHT